MKANFGLSTHHGVQRRLDQLRYAFVIDASRLAGAHIVVQATSAKQLVQRIDHFVAAYNTNCRPFKWTATADSILEKLHRLCTRITGTTH